MDSDDHSYRRLIPTASFFNISTTIVPCPEPSDRDIHAEPSIFDCNLCHHNQVSTVIIPCCHACMCDHCAYEYAKISNTCPVCRTGIEYIARLYLSRSIYQPNRDKEINTRKRKRELEKDIDEMVEIKKLQKKMMDHENKMIERAKKRFKKIQEALGEEPSSTSSSNPSSTSSSNPSSNSSST
jgi:hypothetical protein